MEILKTATAIVLVAVCALGCGSKNPNSTLSPGSTVETKTPSADDNSEVARTTNQAKEPASAQEVIQAMQERLQASIVEHKTKEPAPKDVEATIQFGKQQRERFPDDVNLTQALGAMMFQSVRFLQDDPPKLMQRRLELGVLARNLLTHPEVVSQVKDTLSFLLLEESKGLIQKEDTKASWKSIQDAHELGFNQSKLFYLDPAFEPIIQAESYEAVIKSWLNQEIDASIAGQEAFPLSLSMQSLDDPERTISLEDFQDKKLILVDLWGTWCPPCRAAIPHLVEIQKLFADDLAVLGVNFEQPVGSATREDAQARLQEFRQSQPINYPCGYGDFDPRSSIPGFQGFPTMLVLNTKGRVQLVLSGYHPQTVLETAIRRVLASSP